MTEIKRIHDFAVKWIDKFRNQKIDYLELVDHFFADDCDALGFEMDCGNAFSERYGDAAHSYEALDKIIDDVTDVLLLGSAIYSRWRYFNHWAYTGAEILEYENRAWFILALSRLAILSGENPFIFQGVLKKMRIMSNNICYGSMPNPNDEVEQHLTINKDGRVWFSGYKYGCGGEKYEKVRSRNFKIEKTHVDRLFNAISAYFSNEYNEVFATDIGDWVMELTNTDGVTYKFRGSLCANFEYEGDDLSDLIRETVRIDDLYVFDGNCKPDIINKVLIDYHRVTRIKPEVIPEGVTWEYATWDYSEQFIIDRKTETLEHIQVIGTGCKVSHKYEVECGIENLLDGFDSDELFTRIEGNPSDVVETPNETKDYTITIDYKRNPQRVISGSYDKRGLPEDFPDFAEKVFDFIRFYGFGEILDPSVYGKVKRRKTEYIYCSVTFEGGGKIYYYLTDDDDIEVGDFVLVPAGKDNHEAVVEVVDIEYFNEENAPLSIGKTKYVLRKCTDNDLS